MFRTRKLPPLRCTIPCSIHVFQCQTRIMLVDSLIFSLVIGLNSPCHHRPTCSSSTLAIIFSIPKGRLLRDRRLFSYCQAQCLAFLGINLAETYLFLSVTHRFFLFRRKEREHKRISPLACPHGIEVIYSLGEPHLIAFPCSSNRTYLATIMQSSCTLV